MLKRLIGLVGGAVLLTGCSVYGNLDELKMRNAQPEGTAFTKALAMEYQKFSEFEMFQMYDHVDADYFARKGVRVAMGEVVAPEDPANWNEPADSIDELNASRARLISALDSGGREAHPIEAAVAQAKYDCWVEQQEENFQPDDIAACKQEFFDAIAVLEKKMEPAPAPAPEPMMEPASFIVFFDFDDSAVNQGAAQVLSLVNSKFGDYKDGSIALVGHTDTSGSNAYNDKLSLDRANNVRFSLIEMGVPASAISVDAKGESEPLEATGDGVKNPQNRRVEITIK
ncbi:OmpA family protein [Rhodospirillaceae bacterium KN72]|uniref:OmpA family protein n=1 Tax=Pacificispira spongiicola TaxID=2729598 RepID=A0A7Y0DX46_9PROT|nr:OmpA family protein [Pacificispira spongiicola]NMM43185.1 OmpA family protein [Pacificispira spongiicola]